MHDHVKSTVQDFNPDHIILHSRTDAGAQLGRRGRGGGLVCPILKVEENVP